MGYKLTAKDSMRIESIVNDLSTLSSVELEDWKKTHGKKLETALENKPEAYEFFTRRLDEKIPKPVLADTTKADTSQIIPPSIKDQEFMRTIDIDLEKYSEDKGIYVDKTITTNVGSITPDIALGFEIESLNTIIEDFESSADFIAYKNFTNDEMELSKFAHGYAENLGLTSAIPNLSPWHGRGGAPVSEWWHGMPEGTQPWSTIQFETPTDIASGMAPSFLGGTGKMWGEYAGPGSISPGKLDPFSMQQGTETPLVSYGEGLRGRTKNDYKIYFMNGRRGWIMSNPEVASNATKMNELLKVSGFNQLTDDQLDALASSPDNAAGIIPGLKMGMGVDQQSMLNQLITGFADGYNAQAEEFDNMLNRWEENASKYLIFPGDMLWPNQPSPATSQALGGGAPIPLGVAKKHSDLLVRKFTLENQKKALSGQIDLDQEIMKVRPDNIVGDPYTPPGFKFNVWDALPYIGGEYNIPYNIFSWQAGRGTTWELPDYNDE